MDRPDRDPEPARAAKSKNVTHLTDVAVLRPRVADPAEERAAALPAPEKTEPERRQ